MNEFVQSRIIIKGGSGNEVAINKIKKFNDNYILATINEIQNNSNEQNGNKLGQGSFGSVFLYNNKENNTNGNKKYAVKTITIDNDTKYDDYLRELLILDVLRTNCQTHVMCYKESYIDFETSKVYIVCEYLDDYVVLTEYYKNVDSNSPNIEALAKLFHNLINGMNKMHEMNVYHRDIKPANILYNKNTYDIKYIDFGVSILPLGSGVTKLTIPTSAKIKVGTPNYMDPLIAKSDFGRPIIKYDEMIELLKHADRFSLGMTLFMLLSNGKFMYQLTTNEITEIDVDNYLSNLENVLKNNVFDPINTIDADVQKYAKDNNLTYESYKSLLGINDTNQTNKGGNSRKKRNHTKKTIKHKRSYNK